MDLFSQLILWCRRRSTVGLEYRRCLKYALQRLCISYISSYEEQTALLVQFEAFTAVTKKNVIFWDVALCRSCVNRRFGGTYRLHLQGRRIRKQWTSVSRWLVVHRSWIFLPLRWRRHFPPKRRLTQDLHSATSQKTFFISFGCDHISSKSNFWTRNYKILW
jgi:hypothetical protein